MRMELTPSGGNHTRIVGYCSSPNWGGERSVISLLKINDEWFIGSSMSFPSNVKDALKIKKCFDAAFKELAKAKRT